MAALAFLVGAPMLDACSCAGFPFLETASRAEHVVRAKVMARRGVIGDGHVRFVDFAIVRQYRGELGQATITVEGDGGMSCRLYNDRFEVGSDWLLIPAIATTWTRDAESGEWIEQEPDRDAGELIYELSSCGTHALPIHGQRVVELAGHPASREVDLGAFERMILD